MIAKEQVEAVVASGLEDGHFIVSITVSPANAIVVTLDGDNGIGIDSCVKINRLIESNFDREKEDYELKVESAGVGSPLLLPRQYRKNIGRTLQLVKTDGEKLSGLLVEADDDVVVLEVKSKVRVEGSKKKKELLQHFTVPYTEIKVAKVKVSFK